MAKQLHIFTFIIITGIWYVVHEHIAAVATPHCLRESAAFLFVDECAHSTDLCQLSRHGSPAWWCKNVSIVFDWSAQLCSGG